MSEIDLTSQDIDLLEDDSLIDDDDEIEKALEGTASVNANELKEVIEEEINEEEVNIIEPSKIPTVDGVSLRDKILEQLGSYTNRAFLIIFNGSFLMDKNKYVRVKAIKTSKGLEIMFFTFKSYKSKTSFEDNTTPISGVLDILENSGNKKVICGIDFSEMVSDGYYVNAFYRHNILEIKTKVYVRAIELAEKIADESKVQGEVSAVTIRSAYGNKVTITASELNKFLTKIENKLLQLYVGCCKQITYELKRNKSLQFYNYKQCFIPLIVEAPWIYNPFISLKGDCYAFLHETRDILGQVIQPTTLGKKMYEIEKTVDSIRVKYIAKSEFCKAIGMKKFLPITLDFALDWLVNNYGGNSLDELIYVRRYKTSSGKVTVDTKRQFEYTQLLSEYPEQAKEYVSVSQLALIVLQHLGEMSAMQVNGSEPLKFNDVVKELESCSLGYRP